MTGAADDRTFVVTSATNFGTSWYLLRLTPGAADPAQLTKLPIRPINIAVTGLALSPDGRELAIMYRTGPVVTTYLVIYSLSSGAVLHSWGDGSGAAPDMEANAAGLSWVDGDRSIDFRYEVVAHGAGPGTVRTIDLTAGGTDLLASSRIALTMPDGTRPTATTSSAWCVSSLAAADGTIVCGNYGSDDALGDACPVVPPSFVSYSGTTGKQLRVLYQYRGHCQVGEADVLWTDPGARHVIALLVLQVKGDDGTMGTKFGLVSDGHFTSLKLAVGTVAPQDARDNPGGFAF